MLRFCIFAFMEKPTDQISYPNDDANNALLALERLSDRQAAKELLEAEQTEPVNPLIDFTHGQRILFLRPYS
jgi:hypothetical protein